jgi:hypothetical protein
MSKNKVKTNEVKVLTMKDVLELKERMKQLIIIPTKTK